MKAKINHTVLPPAKEPVLRTLAAMDRQISLLRKQKVGATTVKSEAVEALHSLVLRAREEVRQIAGGHL
jgi:hypothetical protein